MATLRIPKRPGNLVDKIGELKAKIAQDQKDLATLREALIETGESVVEGKLFRATIASKDGAKRIDYRAICDEYDIPATSIAKHTKVGKPTVQVDIKARLVQED